MNGTTSMMEEAAASPPRVRAIPETATWIRLGSVEKIAIGQGRCFVVDGQEIAVFRPRSGRIRAIQNRCPHLGAPLCDGVIGEDKVVCPFHAYKFNLSTGGGEGGYTVKVYDVREESGEILVRIQ